jgi:5-enolpyruvylshikimate-3-phosphate synthase
MPTAEDQLRSDVSSLPKCVEVPTVRARAGALCELRPPGSKSLTNRALLLGALASGHCQLRNALMDADDAQRMITALRLLGAARSMPPSTFSAWAGGCECLARA